MRRERHNATRRPRAGLTMVELVIALAILGLVLVNVSTIVKSSTAVYNSGALVGRLEDQAQQVMDRIAYAILSARAQDLQVPPPPLSVSTIDYETLLGIENGHDVWGDPSRIELDLPDGQVLWRQNPDGEDERRVVWTKWVPELLEDEIANGEDDNGNALFDEAGLAFGMEDGQVTIRLTLRRTDNDRTVYIRTLEARVTCRN